MVVCVPVTDDGLIEQRWGRAHRVAVAIVTDAGIAGWEEFSVGWGNLHDAAGEGDHHARIARFLREHGTDAVVAGHMGPPMAHILAKMRIEVHLGATGDARDAIRRALSDERSVGA